MGKVVTSQGLNEFVTSGKYEQIKSEAAPKQAPAPPLEVVKTTPPVQDLGEKPKEPPQAPDEHIDEDPETQAEIDKSERFRKAMNRKHYALKQAEAQLKKVQDEISESEEFSKNQYNRARLAEERAAQLDRELQDLRAKAAGQPVAPELVEPKEDDPKFVENGQFNWRKFTKEQAQFVAAQAVAEDRAKQEKAQRD